MIRHNLNKSLTAMVLAWAMLIMPLAAFGQTRISLPKNKYKVQDDIKIGNEAAAQVDRQFPILNDSESTRYIESVGENLVASIPPQFRQPAFDYRFKIVNASDINAFALPGGPMYVNRGMIEAARNEGEMAGVMAHEISHVALRHATAQQTKVNSPLNQILGVGAILGGAILGGQAGAQAGQIFAAGYFLRYSRDYETQADVLGAQIMANAGYDPRDLANMFRTIEQQSGGSRTPEWLSSHPNPGNRFENINREASLLRVSPNPIKLTRGFERIQSKMRALPKAPTMAQIEQGAQTGQNTNAGTVNGNYESRVAYPSTRTQVYRGSGAIEFSYPSNWQIVSESQGQIWAAPQGAFGNQGITHGTMLGTYRPQATDLAQATDEYVNSLLQANSYLRQNSNYSRSSIGGRPAYAAVLEGRSSVTGRNETVTIYTTQLRSGDLFYVAAVSPSDESSRYSSAFRNMLGSIRLND